MSIREICGVKLEHEPDCAFRVDLWFERCECGPVIAERLRAVQEAERVKHQEILDWGNRTFGRNDRA